MAGARHREFKKLKRQIYESRIQQMQAQGARPVFNKTDCQKKTAAKGFFGIEALDAALGFMICFLRRLAHLETATDEPILWCHILGRAEFPSLPYIPGLSMTGTPTLRFLTASVRLEKDMLWALEEGLSMTRSPLIVGVNAGREKIYDFTASRRLSLRASQHNSRLLLLRPYTAAAGSAQGSKTTAATRWQIAPRPSRATIYRNAHTPAMGPPRWNITLTRCKGGKTGNWTLEWDHETFSFHLASSLVDRKPAAQPQRTIGSQTTSRPGQLSGTGG